MTGWIKITSKYTSRCIQCGEWISVGDETLWMQGLGVKHEECPSGLEEDKSELIIIDEEF